jgi:hypothetical protein
MEYRGKQYILVEGIQRSTWKWTVPLDEGTVKSGTAETRAAAMNSAGWLTDKALASKK